MKLGQQTFMQINIQDAILECTCSLEMSHSQAYKQGWSVNMGRLTLRVKTKLVRSQIPKAKSLRKQDVPQIH